MFWACNIKTDPSCVTKNETDYPGYGIQGPDGDFPEKPVFEFTPTSGGKNERHVGHTVSITATPTQPNTRSKTIPDLDLD